MWNYSKKSMPNHYAEDSKSQTTCWDVQTLDHHTMLKLISPGRKNQFLWSYKPDWGLKIFMVPHLMFMSSYNWLVEGEKINSLTIHIWCEEEEKHNLIWQKRLTMVLFVVLPNLMFKPEVYKMNLTVRDPTMQCYCKGPFLNCIIKNILNQSIKWAMITSIWCQISCC